MRQRSTSKRGRATLQRRLGIELLEARCLLALNINSTGSVGASYYNFPPEINLQDVSTYALPGEFTKSANAKFSNIEAKAVSHGWLTLSSVGPDEEGVTVYNIAGHLDAEIFAYSGYLGWNGLLGASASINFDWSETSPSFALESSSVVTYSWQGNPEVGHSASARGSISDAFSSARLGRDANSGELKLGPVRGDRGSISISAGDGYYGLETNAQRQNQDPVTMVVDFHIVIREFPKPLLQSVEFSGLNFISEFSSDPSPQYPMGRRYSGPQWEDANLDRLPDMKPNPMLYASSGRIEVDVVIALSPIRPDVQYLVRGTIGGFYSGTSVAQVEGATLKVHVVADKPLEARVLNTNVATNWAVSSDGGLTWSDAGSSQNDLYVCAAAPKVVDDGGLPAPYLSVVYFAVTRNYGRVASDRAGLVAGTWTYFDMNDLSDAKRIDGTSLTYWGAGLYGTLPSFYTAQLLRNADGRCGAWARLFLDMLAINGVVAEVADGEGIVNVRSTDNSEQLMIQSVTFAGSGSTGMADMPYIVRGTLYDVLTGYAYPAIPDVTGFDQLGGGDADGLPGQRNVAPPEAFVNHALVKLGGRIYDPSYGKTYQSITSWEDASLAGFLVPKPGDVFISEQIAGKDLNGLNGATETFVVHNGLFARGQRNDIQDVVEDLRPLRYISTQPQQLSVSANQSKWSALPTTTTAFTPIIGFIGGLSIGDVELPNQPGNVSRGAFVTVTLSQCSHQVRSQSLPRLESWMGESMSFSDNKARRPLNVSVTSENREVSAHAWELAIAQLGSPVGDAARWDI